MVTERSSRLLALALLGGVLVVLLMAAGTLTPASGLHHYPDADDLSQDYAAHQGERVEVAGTVVRTDPVVIEVDDADRRPTLTVTNVTEPVTMGQELRVFGTAQPNGTIAAHETVIVSPWETYYMWTVSSVAGVWVLVRFLREWRFDRSTLSFASGGSKMPDLLTHALVMYSVVTVASWRYEWLTPSFVTVAMMGAMIPDMTKIRLLVPSHRVQSMLGIPFDWLALHSLGGSVVAVLIGTVLVPRDHRTRVLSLLALGAASHLLLDALLANPSGHSYAILWPLTQYHPPTPGLYLSTDRWPAIVSGAVAAVVWGRTRRLRADRVS